GPEASPFERLALAGRMIKESGGRQPRSIGLSALGESDAAASGAAALLAAGLAGAFGMPAFRSGGNEDASLGRLVLLDSAKVDIPYAAAVARGTNLVRWLTALPPNMLDARGYHATIAKLARNSKLGFEWLDEKSLRRAGANA